MYAYRWIVLAVWMLCNTVLIGLWICYAPVASRAAALWGVSEVQVGLLAMTFMYVYLATSLPASWVLGRFGLRRAVGVAMVVMGVAAGLRGAFALDYAIVLAATVALAAVQPFIEALLDLRGRARTGKDYATADVIRDRLITAGVEVRDTPDGAQWSLPISGGDSTR